MLTIWNTKVCFITGSRNERLIIVNKKIGRSNSAEQNTLIVSRYPISHAVIAELQKSEKGNVETLIVSTIVKRGTIAFFRYLRSLTFDCVVVYLQSTSERPLLPILVLFSFLIPARIRFITIRGEEQQSLKQSKIFRVLYTLIKSFLTSIPKTIYTIFYIEWLLRCRRIRLSGWSGNWDRFVFLN